MAALVPVMDDLVRIEISIKIWDAGYLKFLLQIALNDLLIKTLQARKPNTQAVRSCTVMLHPVKCVCVALVVVNQKNIYGQGDHAEPSLLFPIVNKRVVRNIIITITNYFYFT